MRVLVDTHILLWWLTDDPRLTSQARKLLETGKAQLWVSTVTAWELAIKLALGKLTLHISLADLYRVLRGMGFRILTVRWSHAAAVQTLSPHHSDPFDRLLVAQAQMHNLAILTHDRSLSAYPVPVLLV